VENGNIQEHMQENPDADRMRLLSEVASGMEFLHDRGIVHGDLCARNILIDREGKAFVSGFDLCEFKNLDSRVRWLAPEMIAPERTTPPTEDADIWSFGLLCLEVFTRAEPYPSYPDIFVPVLLIKGVIPEHPGATARGLSPKMWELMQFCWKINPEERPQMSAIHHALRGMLPPRDLWIDSSPGYPRRRSLTWKMPPKDSLKDSGYNSPTSTSDDTSQVAKAINAKLAREKLPVFAPPRKQALEKSWSQNQENSDVAGPRGEMNRDLL